MIKITEFFLNEKPVRALIALLESPEEMYCSKISKEIDTTYAHTIKILSRLEEQDIIHTEKEGRRKYIRLTSQGEQHAEKFQELLDTFDGQQFNSGPKVNGNLEFSL